MRSVKALGFALTLAALAVAATPTQVKAQRTSRAWSVSDAVLAASFTGLLAADVDLTHTALAQGSSETNPFIGPHPSVGKINIYGTASAVFVLGVAAALPHGWKRTAWLTLGNAVEVYAVLHNAHVVATPPILIGNQLPL